MMGTNIYATARSIPFYHLYAHAMLSSEAHSRAKHETILPSSEKRRKRQSLDQLEKATLARNTDR